MNEFRTGWQKIKRDSLLESNVTEVAYIYAKPNESPWAVVADFRGVTIRGESPKFTAHSQLQAFAQVMGDAMAEYLKLRKCRIQLMPESVIPQIPGQ